MRLPLPDYFPDNSAGSKPGLRQSYVSFTTKKENEENACQPADDELLIRRAFKSSAEEGCDLLFRRYHRALCSHAIRFVYSREVAEDIVSDVFCKFWKNSSFDSVNSTFRQYLFQSVRHQAYSHLRNEFRELNSLETSDFREGCADLRPDHITQYEETFNRVKELVTQLPPQCRMVFLLNRFEGKRYKEIAKEMGLSVKTVDTHLVKAVGLMRQGMRDYLTLSLGLTTMFIENGWPL